MRVEDGGFWFDKKNDAGKYEKVKVKLHDILYIEALKDYCILVTSYKRYCVFSSIGNLIKESQFSHFIRIHRSYAVQKQFVEKVGANEITLFNNTKLPIGNAFKSNTALL